MKKLNALMWGASALSLFSFLAEAADTPFMQLSAGTSASDAWYKAMADLDGDGRDDLMVGTSFGPQRWYRSNAGDTWTEFTLDATSGVGTESGGAVGDVEPDGDIDVLIGGTLYLNPRVGGGAVTSAWPKHTLAAGRAYHDCRMADFDGDGKMDVAARSESAPSVDIYFQNNPISWAKVTSNPGFGNNGLHAVRIDGDAYPDLVTARHWMKNPGTRAGNWTAYAFNSSWDSYAAIDAADMNNDGRRDLVMTISENTPGPVNWFENPANPATTANWTRHDVDPQSVNSCHSVFAADVDGDGILDVVTSEFRSPYRVLLYHGSAGGASFARQVIAATEVHNLAVGDYDNDGDIDLFGTVTFGTGTIKVFRNDRPPGGPILTLDNWTYIPVDNGRAAQEFGLGFGDATGDGFLDITSGGYFYKNPGADMTAAWSRVTLPGTPDANFITDVDGDANADVIAQELPNLIWFEATSATATSFTALTVASGIAATSHGSSQGYKLGQIVAGGKPEIVLTSGGGIYFVQIPANPSAGGWPVVNITAQSPEEGLALGDIDGDGDNDVAGWLGSGSGSTTVSWWENPGTGAGNWTQRNAGIVAGGEGDRLEAVDVNGDGWTDIVATETNNGSSGNAVYWFQNPTTPKTTTSWTRRTLGSNLGAMNSMDAADMDNDGDVDVITGEHRGPLRVVIWENVSNGASWTQHAVATGRESHLGARVADLDNDGDLEIASICWDAYQYLHLWRNDAKTNGSVPIGAVPRSAGLSLKAYPNPFSEKLSLVFTLAAPEAVHLALYDLRGCRIETLMLGTLPGMMRRVEWNGSHLTPGVYVARLRLDSGREARVKVVR